MLWSRVGEENLGPKIGGLPRLDPHLGDFFGGGVTSGFFFHLIWVKKKCVKNNTAVSIGTTTSTKKGKQTNPGQ